MKRKIIALLLAIVTVVSVFPISSLAAIDTSVYTQPTVAVESVTAIAGSTVDVNLVVVNNPGIAGAKVTISYDEKLTLIGATSGETFSDLYYTRPGVYTSPCNFNWDSESSEVTEDGVLLTLTFQVSADTDPDEKLDINLSYKYGHIYNEDLDSVAFDMVSGYVNVINFMPGDVNSDGDVSGKDVTLTRRYNAGGYDVTINCLAADVNDDGDISGKDITLIRRYNAGGYDVELIPSTHLELLTPPTTGCSHIMKAVQAKSATCTQDGNCAYWRCSACNKCFTDATGTTEIALEDTVLPKTGHTVVIDPAVAPTNNTSGLTEGSHCSVCNTVIIAQEVIPPTNAETYNIDYDIANGDPYLEKLLKKGEIKNPNANYYEEGTGITLSNLSVPGYRFLGWYDLAENGTLIKKIDATAKEDYQLYAYWSKIQYTVQYKSSLFVDRAKDTYTVDTGLVLPTPKLSNYTFTGWADEDGNLYSNTMIPVGSTDNLILEANWTSERNKTWTKTKLDEPIRYIEDNVQYFVYEIGEIQNVPLYTIKDFGYIAEGGVEKSEETTFSMVISEGTAQQIAESVERATTSSSNWSLSSGWNESTDISQEWLDEKGYEREEIIGRVTNEESNWNVSTGTNGSTDTSTGSSNEKGWSNEAKITSSSSDTTSSSINAGLESTLGAEGFGVKAEISASLEAEESASHTSSRGMETGGSKSGTTLNTNNTTTSSGWSNSSSYGGSKSSSESKSTSTSVSEVVTEKYGYGKNYTSEYTSGESQGLEYSNKGAEEWSSSVTYNVETAESVTRSWTTEQTKAGYHRWIMAGIAHVFAVVGYDMETQSYFVYTYTVMDDKTYEFEDYSYTSAQYNDCENGVISFEIPYEVAEYVAEQTCYTKGLKVDQDTGIITGYTGTDNCVVIPDYMNVGGGDVVKVTGLAEGAFMNNTTISAVTLPDCITAIPNDCFNGCSKLEGITGGSIKTIGHRAFAGTAIAECAVRSQVTRVGENAFTGVGKVYFNCANSQVLQSVNTCGANKIYVDLGYLKDISEANGIELSIPAGTEYFEIDGDGKAVKDMTIDSGAAETVFTKINLTGTAAIPVKTSSGKVVLNQSSISATGIALVLSADQTELYLQSTVNITSENDNAVLAKSVTLKEFNDNVDGRLSVGKKLLYVENVENTDLIIGGTTEKISAETFDNMLNSYTLYFDANGGTCSEESRTVPNSTKIGVLPTPTRTHYSFDGWFLDNGTEVTAESVFSTGADVYVYAKWSAVPYTVSWNEGTGYTVTVERTASPNAGAAAGVLNSGDAVYYGDVLNITYAATTGYNITNQGITSVTVEGNVTASDIYATAEVNAYTASWTTGTGYSITVSRTSSPLKGASAGVLNNGDAIYYGDVLTVAYAASTGYSLTSHGGTSFTVTGNLTKDNIYANPSLNSYTYRVVYRSSNGTDLGSTTVTYKYGTTNTISAPAKSGYTTPGSQSVVWDSTSAKTITFTYTPIYVSTSQWLTSGVWWNNNGVDRITYNVTGEYRNRTATSVQVRIVWTQTIYNAAYGYKQNFYCSLWHNGSNMGNTGSVQIASTSTWPFYSNDGPWHNGSVTAYSNWITVPLSTTNSTVVEVACDWSDGCGRSGSWGGKIINIPAY